LGHFGELWPTFPKTHGPSPRGERRCYRTVPRRVPRPLFVGLGRFRQSETRAFRDGNFGGPPHLGHHATDVTHLSEIEKVTISANDFYWGSALKLSGAPSFKGVGTASPQSSPMGIYNGALIRMMTNINDLNECSSLKPGWYHWMLCNAVTWLFPCRILPILVQG
jgi:hypothetical protein